MHSQSTSFTISDRSTPSVRAHSRRNRVFLFRQFIMETYQEHLYPRSNVLDIAGGKGNLSWLLNNVDNLESIVLDPRVTDHSHLEKSVQFLRDNPDEAIARAVPGMPTHQPIATLLSLLPKSCTKPKNIRILVDDELVSATKEIAEHKSNRQVECNWEEYFTRALHLARKATSLENLTQEEPEDSELSIQSADKALNILTSASLIVGFHPDQATEACIDLAILLRIPFAVCPCCVFPSEFPNRRLLDGRRVLKYEEFLKYLQEKHPSIRTAQLSFHKPTTKGTILYTIPGDV